MNSYSFRISAVENGVEVQSLRSYVDFITNLEYLRKKSSRRYIYNVPKGVKRIWFPLVICADWGNPRTHSESVELFNYIVSLDNVEHFYFDSVLKREHRRANGKDDIYCTVHYKADMPMNDLIVKIASLWGLTVDFKD